MMRPTSIIEARKASIDTLAITVSALKVSGKQMTLAVFRQLPVNCMYNGDGTLRKDGPEIWGLVRYAIKDEGDLWVVNSEDGQLFRANVDHTFGSVLSAKRHLAEMIGKMQKYREVARALKEYKPDDSYGYRKKVEYLLRDACPYEYCYSGEGKRWLESHFCRHEIVDGRRVPVHWNNADGLPDIDHAASNAKHAIECANNAASTQNELYDLPQLFIAT